MSVLIDYQVWLLFCVGIPLVAIILILANIGLKIVKAFFEWYK